MTDSDRETIRRMTDAIRPGSGKPDFVNEEGIKWWKTQNEGIWYVQHPDGEETYLGIHAGQIVVASPKLDAVGVTLDLLRADERMTREQKEKNRGKRKR